MRIHHVALAAALLAGTAATAHAQSLNYLVTLTTSPLTSTYTAPYALDFQFFDGGGTGPEPNNTATFANFVGQSNIIMPFSISDGFPPGSGEAVVSLTPGATLRFTVNLTTNVDINSPGPDVLSLALLANNNDIPTTDPSGGNVFFSFTESTNSSTPSAVTYATFDALSGPKFTPAVAPVAAGTAPEPADVALLALGATGLLLARRWRRI